MRIPLARLLDPRPEAVARSNPIRDSVNIPTAELADRTHELPPRDIEVSIAEVEGAKEVLEWMQSIERQAKVDRDFEFGADGPRRLWLPNPFLEEVLASDIATQGRALDLACGSGRDAVFMASLGREVVAADHLPDALDLGRDLERRYAPGLSIDWREWDLERENLPDEGPFALVTCFFFLHRPTLAWAAERLAENGILVVETFTTVHRERFGKPSRPWIVLQPGELPGLVGDLEVVAYSEDWRPSGRHTARLVARRRHAGPFANV